MKTYKNISLADSVDTFASVLGNELVFENKTNANLLLPCFNVGFYENEINETHITKSVDKCYFLFKEVSQCEIELSTYENIYPNKKGLIELDGNRLKYKHNFQYLKDDEESFYIEGTCYRYNSFSYGSYRIKAKSLTVILLNESIFLDNYTSNDDYKKDKPLQNFLLNINIEENFISKVLKA